jgi:predicted phosphodiesterase
VIKHINDGQKEIRFGVVSDTHLASESEDLEHLSQIYDIFQREGIKRVFHAGDISDGMGVYVGQENSLKCIGVAKQAEYVTKHYPSRKGIVTSFITGNHDLKIYRTSGMDIGGLIAKGGLVEDGPEQKEFKGREDLEYLGRYYARVNWNNTKIDLIHPDHGFSYAISYAPQKYINELEGGSKPDILLFGHLHRMMYMNYRNVHLFMAGCFQRQTDFLKRKGISPVRGGWIIDLDFDRKKRIKKVTPTSIQYVQ